MATNLDELKALISIEVDKQKLANAENALKKIDRSFIGIKTAILAAGAALFEFERRTIRGINSVGNTSRRLNASSQDLQELEFAAKRSGISFDSVTGSISKLNSELAGLSEGKAPTALLQSIARLRAQSGLKISLRDDSGQFIKGAQLFNELIPAFQKLTKSQQLSLSNSIFGSNIIPVLNQLAASKKELKSGGLILSDKEISQARKVNNQFLLLGQNVKTLFQRIAIAMSPVFDVIIRKINELSPKIESMAKSFSKWVTDPTTLEGIKTFIKGLSEIGHLVSFIAKAFDVVGKAIGNIAGYLVTSVDKINQKTGAAYSAFPFLQQNSVVNKAIANNTTNNNNKVSNTTIHNNFSPNNTNAIYRVGGLR